MNKMNSHNNGDDDGTKEIALQGVLKNKIKIKNMLFCECQWTLFNAC